MSNDYRYQYIIRQITLNVPKYHENGIIQRLSKNDTELLSAFMAKDLPLVYYNE